MKLRPPAVPLVTVDPYFSVWSPADRLPDRDTVHWTGRANLMRGVATIDGKPYRFMGRGPEPAMRQVSLDVEAMTTTYVFEAAGVRLTALFTTPLLLGSLETLTRPVSYLELRAQPLDGAEHRVSATVSLSEQFVMDKEGDAPVRTATHEFGGLDAISLENAAPRVLERSGDDLRIEWGRVYLAAENAEVSTFREEAVTFLAGKVSDHDKDPNEKTAALTFISLTVEVVRSALVLIAFDDLGKSLKIWGEPRGSVWNRSGKTLPDAMREAHRDYMATLVECAQFSDRLFADAVRAGGEKYAELLLLAYRQSIAAHKLVVGEDGELLFVSKECFSNGCAATVDVSYPSIPLFLLYCPELVRAMMRPIYQYAASGAWPYDYAPHDVGQYPLVDHQRYSYDWNEGRLVEGKQMPVEECGNMLVMEAAAMLASGDVSFASSHIDTLRQWVRYLVENGEDPANQLCTDDFAGHLAHNCNLSLKAVMGVASFGLVLRRMGLAEESAKYLEKAREMAASWLRRAANPDGTFRLTFDGPGTTSQKYNMVWDRLFRTGLMPDSFYAGETAGALRRLLPYGLPLDSRKTYTKSDWTVWTATMADDPRDFEALVAPLWEFYHRTPDRVPMTDWYWADTGTRRGFQARSVQGGLFMRLLAYKGLRFA